MKKNRPAILAKSIGALLAITGLAPLAPAGQVWDGGGGNGLWSTAANWDADTLPSFATPLAFGGLLQLASVNDATASVAGLTFNAGAGAFTLSGNAITLDGGMTNSSANTQTVSFTAITLGSAQTFNASTADLTVTTGVDLGANTLTIDGANNTTLNGALIGTGGLTKNGTGILGLGGLNTYSGATTVNDGTVRSLVAAAFSPNSNFTVTGTGILSLAGKDSTIQALNDGGVTTGRVLNSAATAATLTLGNNNATGSFGGLIEDSGAGGLGITKIGTGKQTFSRNNTYTGDTLLQGGSLFSDVSPAGATNTAFGTGKLVISDGTRIGSTVDNEVISNNIDAQGNFIIEAHTHLAFPGDVNLKGGVRTITGSTAQAEIRFTGVISNGGVTFNSPVNYTAFIIGNGVGADVANTYTGLTTVNDNVFLVLNKLLPFGIDGAIAGNVVQNGTGSLDYFQPDQISDTASVTINGPGNFLGPDLYAGMQLNNHNETIGALFGPGTGIVQLGSATLTVGAGNFAGMIADGFSGVGGKLTKNTTGKLTLSGTNTYTGATTILAGTLQFAKEVSLYNNTPASWTATNIIVNSGAMAAFNVGGPGEFTAADIATLSGLGTATGGFKSGSILGLDTTNASGGNFTYGNVIANPNANANVLGLTKLGTGTLTLSAANTYTGNTNINNGTLALNGSVQSPTVFVNFAGTLMGTGTAMHDVRNAGIFSPGNGRGTFRIHGNYTQTGAGTLIVEIAGAQAGQHDLVEVGGRAALDGTLRLVKVGGARLKAGDKVTFLTAAGGVSGKFAHVENGLAGTGTILQTEVVYEANAVAIEATQGSFELFAQQQHLTPNQRTVASMLDAVAASSRQKKLIAFLNGESLERLPDDFDRIAPDELQAIYTIGTSQANVQTANLQRRMEDIRAGHLGFSAEGLSVTGTIPPFLGGGTPGSAGVTGLEGMTAAEISPPAQEAPAPKEIRPPAEMRIGVFITGTGEFAKVGDTARARGYDLATGGFTLGVDYRVNEHFTVGLNTGYARTGSDGSGGSRVSVDGAKLGAYATYFTGEGFYADAAVQGGYNSYDTRRSALQGTASGSTTGGEVTALIATGFDFTGDALRIGPTASFQYTHIGFSEYAESGSLAPLRYGSQSSTSMRTALGLKAAYELHYGTVVVRPELRAAWQHEFGDVQYAIDSALAGGGPTFTVQGAEIGRESLLLGTGVAVLWNERTATYLFYDGELGRTNYSSNNVSAGVRLSF